MLLLQEVIGLDFACQDEPQGGATPICVKRGSIWNDPESLEKLCALSLPATGTESSVVGGSNTPCQVRNAPVAYSSSTSGSVAVSNTPNQDLSKRISNMQASLAAKISATTVRDEDLQPFPPSEDCSDHAEEDTPTPAGDNVSTSGGQGLTGLPQQYVLFSRGSNSAVFGTETSESSPVVDAAFIRNHLVESPLYERTMEAAASYVIGGAITSMSHELTYQTIIRPCEVVAYFRLHPERIFAIGVALLGFGPFVFAPLFAGLEMMDPRR
jgi:hypothetical protein